MRAEAASWDEWTTTMAPAAVDEDKWHVALAPGEVKVVSLEQLDDLFRLSIVDAETKVWQFGMDEWQPLRVIAGIDDEEDAPPASQPQRIAAATPSVRPPPPPPRPQSTRPAPPPPRPQSTRPTPPPPRPQAMYVAPTPAASLRPAPTSVRPAPTSVRPAPASAWPPPAAVALPYGTPLAFASTQPASMAPVNAFSPALAVRAPVALPLPRAARRGGALGRMLLSIALIGGVCITLYRNDVARDLARTSHQEALYARLEAALGGPSFGTLRSVEQLVSRSLPNGAALSAGSSEESKSAASDTPSARGEPLRGASPPVVTLESLLPEKGARSPAKSEPSTPAEPAMTAAAPKPAASTKSATASAPAKVAVAEKPQPAAPRAAAAEKPQLAAAKVAAAEKPQAKPAKSEAGLTGRDLLNAAIGRSVASTPALPSPAGKSGKGKNNSDYDPLNPKL